MQVDETQGAAAFDELAALAARGDRSALDRLLRLIEPEVLRRCRRFLPHLQDAEEACQDVLLQVARNIGGFEGRSRFRTWLHVIIANCARQTYRGLKRRSVEQAAAQPPVDRVDPRTTSVIAGSRIDLLEAIENLERERPELVAPLVLRDLCQLPYAEVAAHLGLPVGTVKSRVHDARKHVQGTLAERYV